VGIVQELAEARLVRVAEASARGGKREGMMPGGRETRSRYNPQSGCRSRTLSSIRYRDDQWATCPGKRARPTLAVDWRCAAVHDHGKCMDRQPRRFRWVGTRNRMCVANRASPSLAGILSVFCSFMRRLLINTLQSGNASINRPEYIHQGILLRDRENFLSPASVSAKFTVAALIESLVRTATTLWAVGILLAASASPFRVCGKFNEFRCRRRRRHAVTVAATTVGRGGLFSLVLYIELRAARLVLVFHVAWICGACLLLCECGLSCARVGRLAWGVISDVYAIASEARRGMKSSRITGKYKRDAHISPRSCLLLIIPNIKNI